MKFKNFLCSLYIISLINGITEGNESCPATNELEKQCASYAFQFVKPLLDYIHKIHDELSKSQSKDIEIGELRAKLELLDAYKNNIQDLKAQIEDMRYICKKTKTTEESDAETIKNLQNQIEQLKVDKDLCVRSLEEKELTISKLNKSSLPSSCLPFEDSSNIHKIRVPGIDPFRVLCDAKTAGTGWIVIQQRITGEVRFDRDWNAYRKGFGSFDGDFFLGLEKIHRLTSSQRYELYIHMEPFSESNKFAHYNDFKISGEEDGYRLISLGICTGTARWDSMRSHEQMAFSTFDRDNNNNKRVSCTTFNRSGWWNDKCVHSNLNGIYFDHEVASELSIFWGSHNALKRVKMMIRPIRKENMMMSQAYVLNPYHYNDSSILFAL